VSAEPKGLKLSQPSLSLLGSVQVFLQKLTTNLKFYFSRMTKDGFLFPKRALQLAKEAYACEEKEERLVSDAVKHLTEANVQVPQLFLWKFLERVYGTLVLSMISMLGWDLSRSMACRSFPGLVAF
jgi:hypothetical protein